VPIADIGRLVWMPDGRSLVFSAPKVEKGVAYLWRQPVDGRPATVIADFGPEGIRDFAYSPDGKQLAVALGHLTKDALLITEEK
jgi:hypothetical protein